MADCVSVDRLVLRFLQSHRAQCAPPISAYTLTRLLEATVDDQLSYTSIDQLASSVSQSLRRLASKHGDSLIVLDDSDNRVPVIIQTGDDARLESVSTLLLGCSDPLQPFEQSRRPFTQAAHGLDKNTLLDVAPESCNMDDILAMISAPTFKESTAFNRACDIEQLLLAPTVLDRLSAAQSTAMLPSRLSHLGAHTSVADSRPFLEFCPHGTSTHCIATNNSTVQCWRLHFRPIIGPNTVLELGDCSYLNTCFRMDTCRYVHYELDLPDDIPTDGDDDDSLHSSISTHQQHQQHQQHQHMKSDIASAFVFPRDEHLTPPQWINCDIRSFDFSVLGKFSVIMADPPWDIHMSLPYGTMTDDEMRNLPVAQLSDEGIIVLWITGRAMELGRECLRLWGYERVDELVWIKTNQTQRLIRTGRTGHWLNHSKEHCLIGMKGHKSTDTGQQQQQQQQQKPHYQRLYDMINRALISDVIVGEVRETSRKPDQIYGLIDRLVPGRRKLEIFGRQHNTRPGWITLGNQLDGHCVYEPDLVERYNKAYPDSPIELSKTSDTNH